MFDKLAKSIKDRIEHFKISQKYWIYHLGEGMVLYVNQNTREQLLVNQETGKTIKLLDDSGKVLHITLGDIDFESISRLENNGDAEGLWASYYYGVERFAEGAAMVQWTLYPDGRYFEDEDGFGGENCSEVNVYGFMDKAGRMVIPFRAMERDEFERWHDKAVSLLKACDEK